MGKQHPSTWKNHERRIAKALGTVRGGNRGTAAADVRGQWLCVECKSWGRLPARVVSALEQAERAADAGQLPVAVIHEVGARSERDLVILRWGAFRDWFGTGQPLGDALAELVTAAQAGDAAARDALAVLAPDKLEEVTR